MIINLKWNKKQKISSKTHERDVYKSYTQIIFAYDIVKQKYKHLQTLVYEKNQNPIGGFHKT